MTEPKRVVRTTLRPHADLQVTEAEFLDLERQGLIAEEIRPVEEARPDQGNAEAPEPTTPEQKAGNKREPLPGKVEPPRNQKEN